MPRTRPPYPAEFRQQIMELARIGRTPAELAAEFGCSAQTVTQIGLHKRPLTKASRSLARMA
jgi:transposase-like protein